MRVCCGKTNYRIMEFTLDFVQGWDLRFGWKCLSSSSILISSQKNNTALCVIRREFLAEGLKRGWMKGFSEIYVSGRPSLSLEKCRVKIDNSIKKEVFNVIDTNHQPSANSTILSLKPRVNRKRMAKKNLANCYLILQIFPLLLAIAEMKNWSKKKELNMKMFRQFSTCCSVLKRYGLRINFEKNISTLPFSIPQLSATPRTTTTKNSAAHNSTPTREWEENFI